MKEVDPVETVLKARRIPGCEYQGEWPREPEDSAMREPMSDEVLADYERGFEAEGELRGVETCREIRRLRERVKKLDEIESYWGDDLIEAHEDWMTIEKLRTTIAGHEETIERARTMMLELINLLRGFRGNLEKP